MSVEQQLHFAASNETLFGVDWSVAADWTKNDTAYWTITVWLRRAGEPLGRVLGVLDLRTKSVAMRKTIDVWPTSGETRGPARGIDLAAGDAVVAVTTRTGTPAALSNPQWGVTWEPK